ncbi:Sad1/UNC domain protein [Aspergillus glaucus CBS 516.65]|uniref:SUN domain-containing protein n=1 Tax=Aspergillus glaucus CBS 516.65 TaxID=1160497 RepID=A0A1L9VTF0_ASPGL|nr:hypothetical protein ASPGLDRAFT_43664 [Aspergillus glaucus CBS 516.65]OJJ87166.1 hypothetical protein ASPGLDRAFT_43664 [Aspergillus glaucus CBS 516.65]
MLAPGWVYWTICSLSIGARNVVGDEGLSQSTCPVRVEPDVQVATIQWPMCVEDRWTEREEAVTSTTTTTVAATATDSPSAGGVDGQPGHEDLDTESPLDNANFLSFEDWKKQNLAKVGQSVENVGGSRRSGAAGKQLRGRPTGINNALDSLGEDTEIELDFGGFGTTQEATAATAKPTSWDSAVQPGSGLDSVSERERHIEEENALAHSVPRTGISRRKDAGTTCKERFNYASFDCAATVLKTNREGMGSSSVLIENKDSYMLNECRADNKFLILELCDDILVDTVVLANYEFFSSIFHTFRVSVSDRYPAKLDQWKELGVYEARNTREVQAFAVENPLIWARYLKIEFLTHYGHEFYCPLSLIRVHGTTMLEEYKHDGDVGRVEDEMDETLEAPAMVDGHVNHAHDFPAATTELDSTASAEMWFNRGKEIETLLLKGPFGMTDTCGIHATSAEAAGFEELTQTVDSTVPGTNDATSVSSVEDTDTTPGTDAAPKEAMVDVQRASGSVNSTSTTSTVVSETAQQNATETDFQKEDTVSPSPEVIRSTTTTTSTTQPPSPNPTTQESFFKSVNKRLQMLESNSTLSLLYIEEQSRILRDAFNKVEKRQLAKTSTFLENLNQTVLDELKQFREQYDQVWKTVLLEFEHQRIHHHQELYAMSGQLGVLADELVFQKRVAVVQSIMVLVCFGLILFSPRGVVGSYIDFPSVQNMVSRSYSMRSSSPTFESPSMSPSSTRPASYRHNHSHSHHRHQHHHHHHRRNISEDSQNGGLASPTIAYSPPTPTSPTSDEEREEQRDDSAGGEGDTDMLAMSPVESHVRSRSSPPVLNGCVNDGDADYETVESPASSTSPT